MPVESRANPQWLYSCKQPLTADAPPAHAPVFVAPLSRPQTILDLREQLASFQQLYEETVTEMQGEVQKSMEDASDIQKKLVEAHDAATKQLKDYAVRSHAIVKDAQK